MLRLFKRKMKQTKPQNEKVHNEIDREEIIKKEEATKFQKAINVFSPIPIAYYDHDFSNTSILAEALMDNGTLHFEFPKQWTPQLLKKEVETVIFEQKKILETLKSLHPTSNISFFRFYNSFGKEMVYDFYVDGEIISISYHKSLGNLEDSLNQYRSKNVNEICGFLKVDDYQNYFIGHLPVKEFLEINKGKNIILAVLEEEKDVI